MGDPASRSRDPTTATVGLISLGLLIAGNVIAAFLGGIGVIFGLIGSMVVGVYLFGFAPTIATDEVATRDRQSGASPPAARCPARPATGWRSVMSSLPGCADRPVTGLHDCATPTVTAWGRLHRAINAPDVIVQATLAYRYLVVAPEVPEQPVPRQAPARRR